MNFGELRSLLHGMPSPKSFGALIQALHTEPEARHDEMRAQWIPYADTLLDAWPDTARVCPPELVECFELQALCAHPTMAALEHLSVRDLSLPPYGR